MNLRTEQRSTDESHHSPAAAVVAQRWRRDRDYFIRQTSAPGVWLKAALELRPGRPVRAGADRLPRAG
jgi:hypothetical protein